MVDFRALVNFSETGDFSGLVKFLGVAETFEIATAGILSRQKQVETAHN